MKKRLIDFYSNPIKNGIFYSLYNNNNFKELFNKLKLNDEQEVHSLDCDYIYNRSGLKTVSLLMRRIVDGYVVTDNGDGVFTFVNGKLQKVTWDWILSQSNQDIINSIIKVRYLKKWSELADTLSYDYDALNPFRMDTDSKYSDTLDSEGRNETSSSGVSDGITNSSGTDNIFGFNSSSEVPSDSSEGLIKNNNINSSETSGTSEYVRNNSGERTITRKGNIGNKSSQQLIEEQRKLLMYQIFDIIYSDLDSVLTCSKYH